VSALLASAFVGQEDADAATIARRYSPEVISTVLREWNFRDRAHYEEGHSVAQLLDLMRGSIPDSERIVRWAYKDGGTTFYRMVPAEPDSWAPVDLGPMLRGEAPAVVGTMFGRTDGVCTIYPGRHHAFIGESESGKSWAALEVCRRAIAAGEHVLYFDFEDRAETAITRLRLLGATDGAILRFFHYVRPDGPLHDASWSALGPLLDLQPVVAIIDGITEAMVMHGLDPLTMDVAKWYERLARKLTGRGVAVVDVDHVTKATEGRGRNAIGSVHKLNDPSRERPVRPSEAARHR
jgi:hypothetical protein